MNLFLRRFSPHTLNKSRPLAGSEAGGLRSSDPICTAGGGSVQLTGQKLGNITDPKNSRRVNPFATTRPRRWTKELVQNKQSETPDPFIPLCRDVLYHHHSQLHLSEDMLRFLAVQLERGKKKRSALLRKQETPAVLFLCFSPLVKSPSPKQRALFLWLNKKKIKQKKKLKRRRRVRL